MTAEPMSTAWMVAPPIHGDPDYAAYLAAQDAEADRLLAVIDAAPPAPELWKGVPDARDLPGFVPMTPADEQALIARHRSMPDVPPRESPQDTHEPAPGSDDQWPDPPDEAAYHGVLGRIVRAVEPHTEGDPVGILGTLLGMFGTACGDLRTLYQGSLQRTNTSILLVGETGFRGRKGTALDVGRAVFRLVYPELDPLWLVGVASGEAITGHLGRNDGEPRVLLVEPEFGRLLTIMNREGSTLSAVLRNAWDGVP